MADHFISSQKCNQQYGHVFSACVSKYAQKSLQEDKTIPCYQSTVYQHAHIHTQHTHTQLLMTFTHPEGFFLKCCLLHGNLTSVKLERLPNNSHAHNNKACGRNWSSDVEVLIEKLLPSRSSLQRRDSTIR